MYPCYHVSAISELLQKSVKARNEPVVANYKSVFIQASEVALLS